MVYPIAKWIVPPIYKLWTRKVEGLENLPKNKPFILAANHASYYDALLLHVIVIPKLNRQVHALSNSRYWKIFPSGLIVEWGKCIPVYVGKEKDIKKNEQSLKKALECLKKGNIIQIFPEGTRSYDGKIKKGHSGVARLALKAKVPVIPVGIIDSDKVMPKGKFFPRFARCEVKIGKPMYLKRYYGKKPDEKNLEEVTGKVMNEIAKLIGQKYNH